MKNEGGGGQGKGGGGQGKGGGGQGKGGGGQGKGGGGQGKGGGGQGKGGGGQGKGGGGQGKGGGGQGKGGGDESKPSNLVQFQNSPSLGKAPTWYSKQGQIHLCNCKRPQMVLQSLQEGTRRGRRGGRGGGERGAMLSQHSNDTCNTQYTSPPDHTNLLPDIQDAHDTNQELLVSQTSIQQHCPETRPLLSTVTLSCWLT